MTRTQLIVLSVLSALATAAVLAGGALSRGPSAAEINAALAARGSLVASVPAAPAATTPPAADPAPVTDTAAPAAEPAVSPVADTAAGPATGTATPATPTSGTPAKQPAPKPATPSAGGAPPRTQIEHVFQIVLAGHGPDAAFGPGSAAPYLATQLRPQGTLLPNAESLGTADLPDHLALIGGQPPNAQTRRNCPTFKEIPPATKPTAAGVIDADGCVYPNTVLTIGDQLTATGRTWRAYVEDLDKGTPPVGACRRPASDAPDDSLLPRAGDAYATRHNPFVYYHSLLDLGDCDANDGPLARLETDLQAERTTPTYAAIVPNLCNDGTASPCPDGSPGGLAAADAFLATWVPKILASPGFKRAGLLIVTFAGDVSPATAADPQAPVRNGALLVSPFAKAGGTDDGVYDPYGLLRSVQDVLGLKPLAKSATARSFAGTVLAGAKLAGPGDD